MREKLAEHEGALDEALLSNAFAWMRKAADDRLDGMVALLQKVAPLRVSVLWRTGSFYSMRECACSWPPRDSVTIPACLHQDAATKLLSRCSKTTSEGGCRAFIGS